MMLAYSLSSYDLSSNTTENVLISFFLTFEAAATIALESMPPLKNIPTGTSAINLFSTASKISLFTSFFRSQFSGIFTCFTR